MRIAGCRWMVGLTVVTAALAVGLGCRAAGEAPSAETEVRSAATEPVSTQAAGGRVTADRVYATPRRVAGQQIPADVYYGRRLEPPGGRVFHGAGQHESAFAAYAAQMPDDRRPRVMMLYSGFDAKLVRQLPQILKKYDDDVIVQWGLPFPKTRRSDTPAMLARGLLDHVIDDICAALKNVERPIFIRLGYEFNGEWNRYDPRDYRRAWRRFARAIRKHELDHVALVWCYAVEGMDQDYMSWYPGDAYVDWWAIDLFSPEHLTGGNTHKFIRHAHVRGFPVMIGESSARWVGVARGEASWRAWFKRYFDLMNQYPNIKAFCYIQWHWAEHYPPAALLHYWGECRAWKDPVVWRRWREELAREKYIHSGEAVKWEERAGAGAGSAGG